MKDRTFIFVLDGLWWRLFEYGPGWIIEVGSARDVPTGLAA